MMKIKNYPDISIITTYNADATPQVMLRNYREVLEHLKSNSIAFKPIKFHLHGMHVPALLIITDTGVKRDYIGAIANQYDLKSYITSDKTRQDTREVYASGSSIRLGTLKSVDALKAKEHDTYYFDPQVPDKKRGKFWTQDVPGEYWIIE